MVSDDFNDCKSAIRYLEASLFEVPTIVSRIGDFVNVIDNNKNGILVDRGEWYDRIKYLYNNREVLREVGLNANINVVENQLIKAIPDKLDPKLFQTLKIDVNK